MYRRSRSTRVAILAHEHDAEPRLKHDLPAGVQYLFTRSDGPYSHAYAVNRAVLSQRSAHDCFVLVHPAVVCSDALLHRVLREARHHDVCRCYHDVLHVEEREAAKLDAQHFYDLEPDALRYDSYDRWSITRYLVAMRRDAFLRLRGMDERMRGFGFADTALDQVVRVFVPHRGAIEGTLYVAYEPAEGTLEDEDAQRNRALYERDYRDASKKQLKQMLESVPLASLGAPNMHT